jgi:type I restriction enzyme S subunit
VSELPAGWVATTVGAVFAVVGGGTPARSVDSYWEGSTPWITSADIDDEGVIEVRRHISDEGIENSATNVVPTDSVIVVTRVGLGKVARAPHEIAFSQDCQALLPVDGIDPEFLRMQLSHTAKSLKVVSRGTTINGVTKKQLLELPLRIAPVPEQKRIITAIEEQLSKFDAAVAALRQTRKNLERMRASALIGATHGWPEIYLSDIAQVFVGTTPSRTKPEFWGGSIPWVSSGEVAFCRIRGTRETITTEGLGSSTRLHPAGTVLLAMIGEGKTRGQAAILDVPAAHNQNSAAIRLDKNRCLPEWLYYVLMARYQETRHASSGGNQLALNRARIRALAVPLPSLYEQYQLVRDLEQQLSLIDVLAVDVDRLLSRGTFLRASILEQAFSGKLVPQDPEDEPASVLLERLAVERSSSNGIKPSKARRQRRRRVIA